MNLPDDILKRIYKVIGYPILTVEDFKLTDLDVKEVILADAWSKFWEWFPLEVTDVRPIYNTFSIPFPNELTYGVIDVRLNNNIEAGSITLSPFANSQRIVPAGRSSFQMYGTKNSYEMTEARIYQSKEKKALFEDQKTFYFEVNKKNRTVEGYTNASGRITIKWAQTSNEWADVPYERQADLIKYLQAELLEFIGDLRSQGTAQIGPEIDGQSFLNRAERLKEEVNEIWKGIPRIVVLRG